MAKVQAGVGMPTAPKGDPTVHISWPGADGEDGPSVSLTGDVQSLGLGKTARIIVEGTVTGFSHHEFGGSLDIKAKTVEVDNVSGAPEGPSLVDQVDSLQDEKPAVKGDRQWQ
jgi:hypothetical protein